MHAATSFAIVKLVLKYNVTLHLVSVTFVNNMPIFNAGALTIAITIRPRL